jgi:RNA polymerase sigma-70 factor (ECF subfamily)
MKKSEKKRPSMKKGNQLNPEFLHDIEQVYNNSYIAIYRFVYNRIDRKEDAADIVSSSFQKALENSEQFVSHHDNALLSWIFRIASNEVLLYYRKNKVAQKYFVEQKYLQSFVEEIQDPNDNNTQILMESLEAMPQTEYDLIQMKYFDGLSFRDMAVILDKSEESLRVSLHRIRKKLALAVNKLAHSKGVEILLSLAVLFIIL